MGDSVIATMDTYDQQVWAIGKGPSATTVSAPDVGVALGSSVVIRGMVVDVSPGTRSDRLVLRFPFGVPAVSDASMSDWMLYVYKQFEKPKDAAGVDVAISVLDANGNYREIGKTTSSAEGVFSFAWTPDIVGEYKVYASFNGSAGYYPSMAESSFVVDPAPVVEPSETVLMQASMSDVYFVPAVSGFAVAFIVVIVLLAMLLLKKKQ